MNEACKLIRSMVRPVTSRTFMGGTVGAALSRNAAAVETLAQMMCAVLVFWL